MTKSTRDKAGISSQAYRALMRHQAGAVTVVACGIGDERAGLTATAFSSLSDSPPTVLVCVQRTAGAHDVISRARAFSVNILASDQQAVAERFAGKSGETGEARFAGLEWKRLATGAPVLAGALASLDCELLEQHGFTTHSIFIGRVVDGLMRAEAEPLLYFRGDYWNLGPR
ncbi:MAG: flavin reductase family protein [Hyphomicrobiaceae bacterium]